MAAVRILRICFNKFNFSRTIYTKSSCCSPIQIQMPALSPTMEEGTITKWLISEGDAVEIGDAMCEVETDKAVVTMEANEDGTLAKILIPDGTRGVKINSPIAILAEEGEDLLEASKFDPPPISFHPPTSSVEEVVTETSQIHATNTPNDKISPAVRQMLNQFNIEVTNIHGTGPKGIRLKGDVIKYIAQKGLNPVHQHVSTPTKQVTTPPTKATEVKKDSVATKPPVQVHEGDYEDLDLSSVRKVIAKRLTESKQTIPHAYSTIDCSINKVLDLRRQLAKDGVKVSLNDFIIKCVASTLRRVPEVNVVWRGHETKHSDTIDISIAVATDGGLITPIITGADRKGLSAISEEIRELASKARSGKLQPHEYQGGSFTISNLGMFGVKEFTAVINPPQSCIMAVGGTRVRPASSPVDLDDDVISDVTESATDSVMTVTMSSDARVVDDELASKFLSTFKQNMENPLYMGLL
uniref:pyruvate dehydrogenase protein X component-like n=1 Tax=Ciona intestinalis TaxID=7719 RepID=UPI000180B890|nr:pyruvate dehydrogenase protein X component-like [Ciona intestinalis]|eukprot:XP_002119257.1 pyruvate dehydrogenase protein X component-like [Ciona intestinalis]